MPFQQMHHQDNEPALELAPIVAPHALNLLGNVGSIDHAGFARAHNATLLDRSSIEVFFVVNRVAGHHELPHLPSHIIT